MYNQPHNKRENLSKLRFNRIQLIGSKRPKFDV